MKKILFLLLSTYFALVFLMPKEQLFYTLKTFLQKQKITISQDDIKDRWIDLKIEKPKLYYDGIESAIIDSISIKPWLLYNSVSAYDIKSGKDVKKMFNLKDGFAQITQAFWNPFVAKVEAEGNFGKVWGTIELKEGKIKLLCEPSKNFKRSQIFRELFKKRDEGYVYESLIK